MSSFWKSFFAALLALAVFCVLSFIILMGIVAGLTSSEKPDVGGKAVLLLDLSVPLPEQKVANPFAKFSNDDQYDLPGLYDVVRLIDHAIGDSSVKGIYIKCGANLNGFASSDELRKALETFKQKGKFIYAYADVISQGAYYIANVADKVYCNPRGGIDWRGFAMQYLFFKGALDKLEIEPQIFYAGQYKSATEPFRAEKMTEPNRVQSTVMLNDFYSRLLLTTAASRKIDTATLHNYANRFMIQTAQDALNYKLVDGLKYDDEVKDEIKERLKIGKEEKINFVMMSKYAESVSLTSGSSSDRIALIYAQGDIVDGKSEQGTIGGETYRNLIRKARFDKNVKAIVLRVNSGGGSAMASENIWRELALARAQKPVVVSFGDVAASGGYYISCNADSIFAQENTITGSIGVFTIVPNTEKFFKDKLGITFDGVKTSPEADLYFATRPMSEVQKKFMQNGVDSIYATFKQRVADGRRKSVAYIDSIGQGRIWTGARALEIGLVDRLGGLDDAIHCAARMAKLDSYKLKEYPEPESFFDRIFGKNQSKNTKIAVIRQEIGEENYRLYQSIRKLQTIMGSAQARMPFEISVQ